MHVYNLHCTHEQQQQPKMMKINMFWAIDRIRFNENFISCR